MSRTTHLFDAATVLSDILAHADITHAFAGNFAVIALGGPPHDTEEILCVVMSGLRPVHDAVNAGDTEVMSATMAGWANRLFVKYSEPIPPVEIEICVAGETGPRNLNPHTVMAVQNLPFLSVTEFMRAKLRVWTTRTADSDAKDILFILTRYWSSIDLNRIPEPDMDLSLRDGSLATMLALLVFCALVGARSLSVTLPDATYLGFHNASSGLDVWLGVRYAAPPVGNLRWRAAQSVARGNSIVNATTMPADYTATNMDEDCLYLNVYSPPRAKNLPVLVWIHGGGWDHNSATQFDPTPLINLSNNTFVAVIIQYRPAISPNDQDARFALEFVQSNIAKFGGSRHDVTIWGQSSGGGTVLELLVQEGRLQRALGTKYSRLFGAAIMSSPWFPPLGKCSNAYYTDQFRNFTSGAGCLANSTDSSMLACLRAAPSSTLKQLNYQMNKAQRGHVNYWVACLEDDTTSGYLKMHPVEALRLGLVAGARPSYISQLLLNTRSADAFVDGHARGVSVYQDAVFACGSTWAADVFKKRQASWRYLFGILPAVHAQDNAYEFPYWYNWRSPTSPSTFAAFGGAITNFTVRRNPNSDALDTTWLRAASATQIVFNMTSPANISQTYRTDFYHPLSGTKE
ncbi:hypothetical protein CTheo_5354 [Ceratobasidium theobromae]|uniref:Carboxylic ester hydrolase n=1 Tax=Ceratobasidium theobromae TaxID=1582974 RepID=A0A5N5QHV1_9AGAM|nr:hypothetical protein CTheo_5354 [Ceratobasidium theobromae]